jgi:CheY-like chemotaxis protein
VILDGSKILIVDDDPDFARAVGAFLEANGYRVSYAENGREGVRRAVEERPDLILMDVIMDERTEGFFAVQEIRRTQGLEKTPIFVVSSIYAVERFRIAPDRSWLGHDEFFSKPVDVPLLLRQINARIIESRTPIPGVAAS